MTDDRIAPPPAVDALAFVAQVERARDATPCPPLVFDPAAVSPEDLERMRTTVPGNIFVVDPDANPWVMTADGAKKPVEVVAEFDPSGRLVHAYGIPAEVLRQLAASLREAGLDPAGLRYGGLTHRSPVPFPGDPLCQRTLGVVLGVEVPAGDPLGWMAERRRARLTPADIDDIVTTALRREISEGVRG